MKRILALLLAVIMCLTLCACSELPLIGSSKTEGKGFETPEEAILAYAKALKEADVDAILSTFAVETYVEHYDLEEQIDRLGAYIFNSFPLPNSDNYTKEINITMREADILRNLSYIYVVNSLGVDALITPVKVPSDQFDDADDFVDKLTADDWTEFLSELEYDADVLYAEDLVDEKNADRMEENMDQMCDSYGAKEIIPLALEVEVDGDDYYLCVDVARYGDKWYNLNLHGTIAVLMGSPTYSAGLVPIE